MTEGYSSQSTTPNAAHKMPVWGTHIAHAVGTGAPSGIGTYALVSPLQNMPERRPTDGVLVEALRCWLSARSGAQEAGFDQASCRWICTTLMC